MVIGNLKDNQNVQKMRKATIKPRPVSLTSTNGGFKWPSMAYLFSEGSQQARSEGLVYWLSPFNFYRPVSATGTGGEDEDHTLANSLRFTLSQDPRVTFCGYSIPHPSDARVNIRVQTTGDAASEVLKDSCQDLMLICQHVKNTFDQAVVEFKNKAFTQ
ncbi:DNA-directed RNA polymerases I and III subunit RPAC2 [Olea europaea subsp. europaea]|uniref:DNA-directed RNA polymerases I and III subunit RPAC2 n=1 Tax=Olea europaea subsp. europaea TaxID=158383 RepID=A0A8S0V052_OLEEU|nr:DNA-directed RNA polymerases I and III subunit RPAC2 [Olea europaea subsp. europaea]